MTGGLARRGHTNNKPTGFILPAPFRNGQGHAVSLDGLSDGKPLLLRPSFHIALCLCGLGIVSLGIMLFCLPFDLFTQGSKLRVKVQRVFIPN
jgi:hypothetical protein